jgi:hypothetical protein
LRGPEGGKPCIRFLIKTPLHFIPRG